LGKALEKAGAKGTGMMKQGPTKTIESIVAQLIPQARREEVLGDLHERYRGPMQYLLDALETVPHVVASQMRRVTCLRLVILEGLALYVSFLTAPAHPPTRSLIFEPGMLLPALIPTAVAVVVLRFVDAYSLAGLRTRMTQLAQAALAVAIALGAEEVIRIEHPAIALPRSALLPAGIVAAFLLWLLRSRTNAGGAAARPATPSGYSGEPEMTPNDIQRGIERLQSATLKRGWIGLTASLILIAAFVPALTRYSGEILRIGALLVMIGGAYGGLQILVIRLRTGRLDTKETDPVRYAEVYRSALVKQRDYYQGAWLWSRMAIFAMGSLEFCAGLAIEYPGRLVGSIATAAVFLLLITWAVALNSQVAQKYQREIDRLDAASNSGGGKTS
jgi:hypothetical protein